MKKIIIFSLIFILFCGLMPVNSLAQDTQSCHGLTANTAIAGSEKLLDTAGSVLMYELNTKTLVYTYHPDKQVNPTGLVKLLTALVALEEGNLEEMVTVYQSTLNLVSPGAVSAGLKDGEKLTLRDLLYCVMVSSANDAAAVIAAHIGGNQAAFVEKMNRKAQELGCTASNFTNAHGLNDPNQYSTARDLALITEAALENETFVEMFCAKSYIVPATNKSPERKLRTTNYMISDDYIQGELDQRVTGGKPAAATNVDRSMICTAEVGAKRYLCVVMNVKGQVSQDGLSVIRFGIFQEMKTLLNFGFQNMQVVQLVDDGQTMYQYPVSGGDNDVFLRPSRDLSVVLPQEYDPDLLRYEHILDAGVLSGPITNGQHMGSLQICYGNILLGNCDLLSMNPVKPEGEGIRPADRIDVVEETKDSGYNRWLILGALVAGAVAVVVFVIWLIIRLVRTADIRRMQRKRARKRQRSKKS